MIAALVLLLVVCVFAWVLMWLTDPGAVCCGPS
jgi:hypothetical protein